MGTIAEALGMALPAPEPEPADTAAALQAAAVAVDAKTGETQDAPAEGAEPDAAPADLAVMEAVIEETGLEAADARADLTLAGDLDLDTLGLYSVVSSIEHALKVSIPDQTVRGWETLGDVLDTARELGATRR